MSSRPLSPDVVQVVDKRELWRKLHQQGDQAGVHRLLEDVHFKDLLSAPLQGQVPDNFEKKLSSFGREWERAITVQAVKSKAHFSQVTLQIDPAKVVQFQAVVEERLKRPVPWGAFLFMESAIPLELTKEAWKATAYFIFGEGYQLGALELASCPGVVQVGEFRQVTE